MRKEPLVTGEYYHIYNRGVDKRDIFGDTHDLERFKESMREFNHVDRIFSLQSIRKSDSGLVAIIDESKNRSPLVAFVSFTVNPNHFHFVLKQLVDGGISEFMHRLSGGYTSYFNKKNNRTGSLFQGTFKSKHCDNDAYFRKIFAYTNENNLVHDIPESKQHLIFSSAHEYLSEKFDFVDKTEAQRILAMFPDKNHFETHCKEIIAIIRSERGKTPLDGVDEVPDH